MYEYESGKSMSGVETGPADLEVGTSGDEIAEHEVLMNAFNGRTATSTHSAAVGDVCLPRRARKCSISGCCTGVGMLPSGPRNSAMDASLYYNSTRV